MFWIVFVTKAWWVITDHVTWTLASDWSRQITWPEHWPLIGPDRSRDLNTGLWLVTCLSGGPRSRGCWGAGGGRPPAPGTQSWGYISWTKSVIFSEQKELYFLNKRSYISWTNGVHTGRRSYLLQAQSWQLRLCLITLFIFACLIGSGQVLSGSAAPNPVSCCCIDSSPEHALDAGVDLLGHVAGALGSLDHQVRALDLRGNGPIRGQY